MKTINYFYSMFLLLISLLISYQAAAQSFVLLDSNNVTINNGDTIVVTGSISTLLYASIKLENISSSSKTIDVARTKLSELPGAYCIFEWGLMMYDTSTSLSQGNPVAAGVIDSTFISIYQSLSNFGSSYYRYNFFDENNPADSSWVIIKYDVVNTIGIEENAFLNSNFYPNPGNGLYDLSFPSSIKSEISTEIFNSSGVLIMKNNFIPNNSPYIIDLQNYPDGIYFFKIFDKNNRYNKSIKIIKI